MFCSKNIERPDPSINFLSGFNVSADLKVTLELLSVVGILEICDCSRVAFSVDDTCLCCAVSTTGVPTSGGGH